MPSWQSPHHALKCNQGHPIRRERPKEAWDKASPVASPPTLPPDSHTGILPAPELPLSVFERTAQRVYHETLLHHVRGVRGEPEDLGRDAACPEIDRRRRHLGVVHHVPGENVVGTPPEEEEGSEEDRCPETAVYAADAVCAKLGRPCQSNILPTGICEEDVQSCGDSRSARYTCACSCPRRTALEVVP